MACIPCLCNAPCVQSLCLTTVSAPQGIHDTIDALSPRRMVLQLQTSGQAGQGTGKETSPSFPRTAQGATFPTARQVAFEPDAPGAPWPEQSSPRRATSGDSVLIKFQAQADAQQQAAREWKTVSHGGASATHADGPQPRTSKPVSCLPARQQLLCIGVV